MKKFVFCFLLILCFCLSACGAQDTLSEQEYTYFATDAVVDDFFVQYNANAELAIPAEKVEKGKEDEQALVTMDGWGLEVINSGDFLTVNLYAVAEKEDTELYSLFRDVVKTMRENMTDEDIRIAWNDIPKTGETEEYYNFNGISVYYVPTWEMSFGNTPTKIYMVIPFE